MTTATHAKTNRTTQPRAPKGGMVSTVNGVWYAGGRFVPVERAAFVLRPVVLMGSWRQVAWANRLRTEKLAQVEARMTELLHEIGEAKGVATLTAAYHYAELKSAREMLYSEPEAGVIIDAFAR